MDWWLGTCRFRFMFGLLRLFRGTMCVRGRIEIVIVELFRNRMFEIRQCRRCQSHMELWSKTRVIV